MNQYTALVLDPDTCLHRRFPQRKIGNITFRPATDADQLSASLVEKHFDFVILDYELPKGVNGMQLITELRKQQPDIPAILLTAKSPSEKDWLLAASKPLVEFLTTPVTPGNLFFHVSRLFQTKDRLLDFGSHEVTAKPVEKLRNNDGRLDAYLVCDLFGTTMTDIAKNVGISRQALTKNPASFTAQLGLRNFERLARSLITVTGSIKGLKIWLNSPIQRFDNHTPLELIKLGKIELLADWVDDARLGSPD
jgi:CheY-like chemotaxis protein